MQNSKHNSESGYALVMVLMLVALGLIVVSSSLSTTATATRVNYAQKQRSVRYYSAEQGVSIATYWLQDNSLNLLNLFTRGSFYTNFERTDPSIGDNDSEFEFPTKLKNIGSNDSIILSSDASLATSNFPNSTHYTSAAAFDPVTEFANIDFKGAMVKVTLVDSIGDTPGQDYGNPPAADPDTDFRPVFRIDSMTGTDSGSHAYAYVMADLVTSPTVGFYGENFVNVSQDCNSFDSTDGPYDPNNPNANCPVGSNATICLSNNTEVYGTVDTNGAMSGAANCGGDICPDIGCASTGEACEGEDCGVPTLPEFFDWGTYCDATQGNETVGRNSTVTLNTTSDDAADKCWTTVDVETNATLILESTEFPYFIQTLDLQNNSNSELTIQPDTPDGIVTLYVLNIVGNRFNGNQVLNGGNRPSQFRLIYLGNNDLTLNGNADVSAAITAPNANVTVSGNLDYYGGILALGLELTGSGSVHYDESLGSIELTNMTFDLKNLTQYYR